MIGSPGSDRRQDYPAGGFRGSGRAAPRRFPSNHRTTIHLVRLDERDLGIGPRGSGLDLRCGDELVGREARIEDNEDLMPQRIEALTLNGIDHRDEILLLVQIVRRIDLVEALILRDD